ncbi:MAG: indolepyruvate oxidoreductase subunit beta [Candidatus Thermoplasmatota archaeon]|nr:indolepyruvate oxidoreductase subunit beta [Candidatus Thermoplasmatota archaeon]
MNIILSGVGGNGVVLTTRIIAEAALMEGIDVRVGEVHGLAMRGGTVVSHLRLGPDAKGVLIPQRMADMMLSFEPLEAIRQMKFLKRGAKVIINNDPYVGVDAHLGLSRYPDLCRVIEQIQETQDLVDVPATHLALKAGNVVMTNVVMLGTLSASRELPIRREVLLEAIKSRVPPHTIDRNIKAFELGEKAFQEWEQKRACQTGS